MPGPKDASAHRKSGVAVALALSLAAFPGFAPDAYALKIFGFSLFETEDETAEVINPVRYDATLDIKGAGGELQDRLETATALVADKGQPVSGDLGLVVKAREDRERLVAVLYEEGHYGGVVHISIGGTDLDQLPPNPVFDHNSPVPVTVTVEAGANFTLGSVTLEGDARGLNPDDYDLKPGSAAGSVKLIQAGERIVRDLKAQGRPLAELNSRNVVADHETNTVSVTYAARSGPVATIGAVSVKGNRAVEGDFIRRYSRLDEQQRYSPDQLKKAGERLRKLGVFSSVTIREADALAADGTLPLTVEISEGKFRYFGAGADFSSIDGAGLSGYWGHRNLFGEAESLRIEGKVSGIGATTDYTTFDYSAGIFFSKPGAFLPRITLDASLQVLRETPDTFTADSITALTTLSYELSDQDTVKGGVELAFVRADDAFGRNDYLTFSTPLSFERDARDNKLEPTQGYRALVSAQPGYEFERGTVFSSFEGSISGYLGLGEEDRLVLAARLAGGTIVGADSVADIPTTRRFYAGGGGSVRGYAYREISPYNGENEALGGKSYTLASFEARVKVTEKVGIVPFFDMGTVSTGIVPDFSDIRMGAGIGLRYATPFGPLRLDVAVPLDRYDDGSAYGIYAGIGQSF